MILRKLKKILLRPSILSNYIKYKILSIFAKKTLNSGERYDPKLFRAVRLSDNTQEIRYTFLKKHISRNDSVLDISCGTGYGTKIISGYCNKVRGYDISSSAIAYATRHYAGDNVNFFVSDFFQINDHADIVVSFETIEHIKADLDLILQRLKSLCSKKVIISAPYMEMEGINKHHYHSQINEKTFSSLGDNLEFYYQTKDGIYEEKPEEISIQNIIVIKNF
ncbi:MAG: class I SAM-dependent methyltransferase [bacterium]|nr:class I SAM-dependent methyltransferase [bacterium]